jgi:hypothetical protein
VARFPGLPTADPGRGDAAFCLFLHVYATSEMRGRPAWPIVAARFLGIAAPAEPPGGGTSRAAGDQAGERTTRDSAPED